MSKPMNRTTGRNIGTRMMMFAPRSMTKPAKRYTTTMRQSRTVLFEVMEVMI